MNGRPSLDSETWDFIASEIAAVEWCSTAQLTVPAWRSAEAASQAAQWAAPRTEPESEALSQGPESKEPGLREQRWEQRWEQHQGFRERRA